MPEFITILRNIRDVLYPDIVRIESIISRFNTKTSVDVDTLLDAGLYIVDTNLPDTKVLGVLDVKGYVSGTAIEQKFIDKASGNVYERTSALGDGTDWTVWTKDALTLRIEALEP